MESKLGKVTYSPVELKDKVFTGLITYKGILDVETQILFLDASDWMNYIDIQHNIYKVRSCLDLSEFNKF